MTSTLSIAALGRADIARIQAHLQRLSVEDRSLRFAAALVTDETIARYVAGIRFGDDAVLGLVDEAGVVVGLVHGSLFEAQGQVQIEAAFSVDAEWRGQGLGHRLMGCLDAFAARRCVRTVVGICHARNLPMRAVFARAGMALTREDDEMHARRSGHPQLPGALQLSGRSGKLGRRAAAPASGLAAQPA